MTSKIQIKRILIIAGLALGWAPGLLNAQSKLPDQQLLRDIEISASVLDQMIYPEKAPGRFFGSPKTKGYYLSNHGVIFNVNYSFSAYSTAMPELELLNEQLKYLRDNADFHVAFQSKVENVTREVETELEKLKKTIIKFLSSWTAPLVERKGDEKITIIVIIVDINNSLSHWPGMPDRWSRYMIASVAMNDIRALRKDSITEAEFARRVKFEQSESSDEEMAILSNIIETALAHENQFHPNVVGIHLKGYGAIFFADIPFGAVAYNNLSSIYKRFEAIYSKTAKRQPTRENELIAEKLDSNKVIQKIEQKLIQLLSDYGNNLKQLQPDEWVEILVDYRVAAIKERYSKSAIRVQKRTIDDFNREKINFDEFKKLVSISYY